MLYFKDQYNNKQLNRLLIDGYARLKGVSDY